MSSTLFAHPHAHSPIRPFTPRAIRATLRPSLRASVPACLRAFLQKRSHHSRNESPPAPPKRSFPLQSQTIFDETKPPRYWLLSTDYPLLPPSAQHPIPNFGLRHSAFFRH